MEGLTCVSFVCTVTVTGAMTLAMMLISAEFTYKSQSLSNGGGGGGMGGSRSRVDAYVTLSSRTHSNSLPSSDVSSAISQLLETVLPPKWMRSPVGPLSVA